MVAIADMGGKPQSLGLSCFRFFFTTESQSTLSYAKNLCESQRTLRLCGEKRLKVNHPAPTAIMRRPLLTGYNCPNLRSNP